MHHLLRILIAALPLAGVLTLPPAAHGTASQPHEVIRGLPLEDFGQDGERLPELARELLPEGFFSRSMTEPLANRRNYSAHWEIPKTRELTSVDGRGHAVTASVPLASEDLRVRLFLHNPGEGRADVVISASGPEVRNFLVGVEGGRRLVLDAGSLKSADTLVFLSPHPFLVSVEVRVRGEATRRMLTRMEPLEALREPAEAPFSRASAYCGEVGRYVDVCSRGNCITAWAERYEKLCCWTEGEPIYYVNVDYPLKGEGFHVGTGASHTLLDPEPCRQVIYFTQRAGGTDTHRWRALDDTLFHCEPSTAECTSGCSEVFEISCR